MAQGLLTLGAGMGGFAGLSVLAFGKREPQVVNIAGLLVRVPAYVRLGRTESARLSLVVAQMSTVLGNRASGSRRVSATFRAVLGASVDVSTSINPEGTYVAD